MLMILLSFHPVPVTIKVLPDILSVKVKVIGNGHCTRPKYQFPDLESERIYQMISRILSTTSQILNP